MLDIRLHVVLGHAKASVWCSTCAPPHALWTGTQYVGDVDAAAQLQVLWAAATEAARAAREGPGLVGLTPRCGR